MRTPASAATLLLSALLSLPLAAQPQRLLSAAQVHRACAHPELQERSPRLYDACHLPISGQVEWDRWRSIQADAAVLVDAVVNLSGWTAGDLPAHSALESALRARGDDAVSRSLWQALASEHQGRLLEQITELEPATLERLNASPGLMRAGADRSERNGGVPDARSARTSAGRLAAALPAQPVSVQLAFLAPFTEGLTVDQFASRYGENALFVHEMRVEAETASQRSRVDLGSLSSAIPLSHQSALLWGAADFVAGRAEMQMQTYFMRQFSSSFCGQNRGLLPSSCGILDGATLATFRPGMGMLRQAVRKDLETLPVTLLRVGIAQNRDKIPREHWDAVNVAASGAAFVVEVVRGTDPTLALRRMADSTLSVQVPGMAAPVSRLLGQFAAVQAGLLDPAGHLLSPLPDAVGAEQQLRRLLLAFAINQPSHWPRLGFEPEPLVAVARELTEPVKQYRVLKASVANLQRALPDTAAELRAARQSYILAASQLVDLFLDRAGTAGRPEAARLRSTVAPLRGIGVSLVSGDYATAALSTFELAAPYRDVFQQTLPDGDMRVFSFVADMAQAENPAAVNAALTRFVGSGGDFQTKRSATEGRFSLNAYLGMYGGGLARTHWMWGEELDDGRRAPFVGPYLPVGMELTSPWGLGLGGRLGVFLQAVDLGALASWRFGDEKPTEGQDSVRSAPEVGFAQVFSPGIAVLYHVPGRPVTVGWTLSYSPALRTLRNGTAEMPIDAVRRGLFVAFDVPLFP